MDHKGSMNDNKHHH